MTSTAMSVYDAAAGVSPADAVALSRVCQWEMHAAFVEMFVYGSPEMPQTGGAGLVASHLLGVGFDDGWGGGEFLGED